MVTVFWGLVSLNSISLTSENGVAQIDLIDKTYKPQYEDPPSEDESEAEASDSNPAAKRPRLHSPPPGGGDLESASGPD